jgi:23S rRNA pseudouridine1911/1915/1917 synthase
VGDTLYGAPKEIRSQGTGAFSLDRNFLHAAALRFTHPRSRETLSFSRPLPEKLQIFLDEIASAPLPPQRAAKKR